MDQITLRHVKGVSSGENPTENFHPTTVLLSPTEPLNVFSLHVLVLQPATLMCVFALHSISSCIQHSRPIIIFFFCKNTIINLLYATCPAPNSRQTKLENCW